MPNVKVYALTTCPYCHQARAFLDENKVPYDVVEVDVLEGQVRQATIDEVKRLSGGTSFPVIVIGDEVLVGFDKMRLSKLVGVE
jgi:glutaredoxin-like protein NrdH